jgi:hypothetical protein
MKQMSKQIWKDLKYDGGILFWNIRDRPKPGNRADVSVVTSEAHSVQYV